MSTRIKETSSLPNSVRNALESLPPHFAAPMVTGLESRMPPPPSPSQLPVVPTSAVVEDKSIFRSLPEINSPHYGNFEARAYHTSDIFY